jgi:hypothetical protein
MQDVRTDHLREAVVWKGKTAEISLDEESGQSSSGLKPFYLFPGQIQKTGAS